MSKRGKYCNISVYITHTDTVGRASMLVQWLEQPALRKALLKRRKEGSVGGEVPDILGSPRGGSYELCR